ncbi:hypothetical protein MJO29_006821 [Puccinia striiformis f. sp. tritici]|nr:hypothetical protein MJO29_006821 [Puccinia striiformis f. sp. tritici]
MNASDAGSTIVDGVVAGAETATSAADDNENTPNAIIPSLHAPIVRQSHRTSIGQPTNVPGSPNSNEGPTSANQVVNQVVHGPGIPAVATNDNGDAGGAIVAGSNAPIMGESPGLPRVQWASVTGSDNLQPAATPTYAADRAIEDTINPAAAADTNGDSPHTRGVDVATGSILRPIGEPINAPTFGHINSFIFDFRSSYVDTGVPTGISMDANIVVPNVPNLGVRASFIEPLVESEDEDLPPAYEEIPVLGAGRPRMVDTPSPRQPRGSNERRFVLRSPPNPRYRRWSPISPTRRRRPAAHSPIRDPIEPDSPAVTYSSRDFQESPPTSPGSAPPMPETPRMRHAELPRTDEEYSAALFEIAFQNGLSSMRETISSYPANHPIARDLRRISRHANLYEAWYYSHRDNLVELIAHPHSQVRLVYDTLFSSMERLIEIDSFFSTYDPHHPEM